MKKLSFIIFILFSTFSVYSQQTKHPIEFDFAWSEKGDLTISALNNDCCDYHLFFHLPSPQGLTPTGGDRVQKVINRGKTQIMNLKRTQNNNVNPGNYTFSFYAGDPHKKPNLDYQYALPVAAGDSIYVLPEQSELYTQRFSLKNTNDTIYASREGIVCDYLLRKTQTLTIYHKDGTLADYKPGYKYEKILVNPGNKVKVGQPIAVLGVYQKDVLFSVYFLEKNKLKERINPHSGLVPLFQVANKDNVKLDFHKVYISELNTDMITQDMSKKEREKYIKSLSGKNK